MFCDIFLPTLVGLSWREMRRAHITSGRVSFKIDSSNTLMSSVFVYLCARVHSVSKIPGRKYTVYSQLPFLPMCSWSRWSPGKLWRLRLGCLSDKLKGYISKVSLATLSRADTMYRGVFHRMLPQGCMRICVHMHSSLTCSVRYSRWKDVFLVTGLTGLLCIF